jgi:hypothetical protein
MGQKKNRDISLATYMTAFLVINVRKIRIGYRKEMSSDKSALKQQVAANFQKNASALNQQFLQFCNDQIKRHPERLLNNGLTDYFRHSATLRREFAGAFADGTAPMEEGDSVDGTTPRSYHPLLSLYPLCNTKVVHFIRHGEGFHNVGIPGFDSHLTPRGWQQARALGRHMFTHLPCLEVQLVVVSPLMRTLETAAGVFGLDSAGPTYGNGATGPLAPLFTGWAEGEEGVRAAQRPLLMRPKIRFVAHEECRERLGEWMLPHLFICCVWYTIQHTFNFYSLLCHVPSRPLQVRQAPTSLPIRSTLSRHRLPRHHRWRRRHMGARQHGK